MTSLHFNYKDVFRACRLGFSTKKIWVQFVGFLVAFFSYGILAYVAHIANGATDITEIWNTYRCFPYPLAAFPWYSWLIWSIGVLFFGVSILIAGTAVSKITYEQLRGDEFYEVKEATKFAFRSARAVAFSPVLLILFAAFLVFCGLILSLIGAIPYFGELFVGVMAIPAFAVSLFIVYLMVVFFFNLVIGPAVIGTTKSDTFDTLFEVFSCVNEQPWRLIVYGILLKVLSFIATVILGFASVAALLLGMRVVMVFDWAFKINKFNDMFQNAIYYMQWYFPDKLAPCRECIQNTLSWFGLGDIFQRTYAAMSWSGHVASFLLGIAFWFILLFVISYGAAIWFAGQTVIYTVLVRKKDDKNLLEVKEKEEEFTPPPAAEKKAEEKKEEKPEKKAEKPEKKAKK